MDYVVLSSLRGIAVRQLLMLYDIMCQWKRRFFERMERAPPHLRLDRSQIQIDYGIPKFHFANHIDEDHSKYSFNLKFGCGRTDGEGIERNWSVMNQVARSTRDMGPGSRHDTLDDHCGHVNWRKTANLGSSFTSLLDVV